ncbi:MAG TPA: FKBP-type peptidyl-prolyl cis-trans isomerase [Hymenobacter sp.]|jgi:FKBP-type peptidyl-prolyl cis-trans isomerase|uniref:FKBP-type peptidyl-prolyl cis-trans isomerase n=1 Tax=Hymenobacter sp. TaxID=1898978 RepID=UPI002ED9AB3A
MNISFAAARFRSFFLVLLSAGALFLSACDKDKDYVKIDENIIKDYIAKNNISDAQRQGSGLYYVPVSSVPTGTKAVAGKTVSVLYTGALMDGTVFDATSRRGNTPFDFVLGQGQVIQGWDEGIALMRKGEKAVLLIPSALGYGERGAPGAIPKNAVLRFEVELVDVR